MKPTRRTKTNRRGREARVGGHGRCALLQRPSVFGAAGEQQEKVSVSQSSSQIRVVQVDN